MNIRRCLTKPVTHAWLIFVTALILIVAAMLLFQHVLPRVGHGVSAAEYATLIFDGFVSSNGVQYGSFTLTNHHQHPLLFHVNNVEISTRAGWEYFASWSPGKPRIDPILGRLDNYVAPGQAQKFLVQSPGQGDAWRIHAGVLRGIRGLTLENRVAILLRTHSLAAAFSSAASMVTGYHHFTFAGMLDGPDILSTTRDSRGKGVQEIRPETNSTQSADSLLR